MRRGLFYLIALIVLAGAVAGCDFDPQLRSSEGPSAPAPEPAPEPVVIILSGGVEVDGTSVNFGDSSSTTPAGHCAVVLWTLRRGTVTVVDSKTTDCGQTGSFGPGLAAGVYSVEQEVFASDGGSKTRTYPELVIGGVF